MSFRFFVKSAVFAALGLLTFPVVVVRAAPINVGSGGDTVEVLFNWPDGFVADYNVHYGASASDQIDVYDATQDATADPNLSLMWENFGTPTSPNEFLNAASYTGGHIGDGSTYNSSTAPNNYWAEWINTGTGWTYGNGASVDVVGNGNQVGWVFGNAGTPVPEPASLGTLAAGAAVFLTSRRRRRFAVSVVAVTSALIVSPVLRAADSVTVVPGTLSHGTVKASLGAGTSYDLETNNLGDWPLTTAGAGTTTYPISLSNADFNSSSSGGTPNTILAFGNGGGVTLQFTTPITPHAGEKDLGIFTAQMITGGVGSFLNGNMDAAILVSKDDANWYTLTGAPVPSPTTYTGITYPLNAPAMAYDYGTDATAWNDGLGVPAANLTGLSVANYTTPMPDDSLFNGAASTNAQRLALATDSSPADYAETFGTSGGGNWFDVSGSGLSQIDYVRLNGDTNDPASGGVRLDAVFANQLAVVPEPSLMGLFAALCGFWSLARKRTSVRF
jgi:hypothetical protein